MSSPEEEADGVAAEVSVQQSITEVLHDPSKTFDELLGRGELTYPTHAPNDDPLLKIGGALTLNDFAAFLSSAGNEYAKSWFRLNQLRLVW